MINPEKNNLKLKQRVSEFSSHLMNDIKWRKIFKLLSYEEIKIEKVIIFNIWETDKQSSMNILDNSQIKNFDASYSKNGINDILIGGPIKFKEIFKILIETNSVKKLSSEIDKLGIFEKEINTNQITILGYR